MNEKKKPLVDKNGNFIKEGGILLPFIDYTDNFKLAMSNWEYKALPKAIINKTEITKIEEDLKKKLRVENKVWALGIIYLPLFKRVDLFLRIGTKEALKPFTTLSGWDLKFSENDLEGSVSEEEGKFTTRLSTPYEMIRQTIGNPFKLKDWYDDLNSEEFW